MRRFILKKDLPTFQAGTKFRITNKGDLAHGDEVVYRKRELELNPNILKDWFKEIPERAKTVWDLEDGDSYFTLCDDGSILQCTWSSHHGFCSIQRECGSAFLTEQDANKELARRKAEVILRHDAKGFKPKWAHRKYDDPDIYSVYYEWSRHCLIAGFNNHAQTSEIHFATQEDAAESINKHKEEWLTYLGVEDGE